MSDLETAQWLYDIRNVNPDKPIVIDYESAFLQACLGNRLETAQWLYDLSQINGEKIDIHAFDELAFRDACSHGHLEMAKWLYAICASTSQKNGNKKINIHAQNEEAFNHACMFSNFETAQWLYDISKTNPDDKIDMHPFLFSFLCAKSYHTNIVRWLYNIMRTDQNIEIDIHADNERYFRTACINGRLQTAKWLYRQSLIEGNVINIRALDDVFRLLLRNDSRETIEWLSTLEAISDPTLDHSIGNIY